MTPCGAGRGRSPACTLLLGTWPTWARPLPAHSDPVTPNYWANPGGSDSAPVCAACGPPGTLCPASPCKTPASPGLSTVTVVLLEALPSKPRRPNHVCSKFPLPPAHASQGHKIPQVTLCLFSHQHISPWKSRMIYFFYDAPTCKHLKTNKHSGLRKREFYAQ